MGDVVDSVLSHLKAFDTPTICNALEVVEGQRLAEGFTRVPTLCALPDLPPIVGFACTATIRSVEPSLALPEEIKRRRLGYYAYVASSRRPTVVVIQDLDDEPGLGAFWGEVNTAVHRGLGLLGCITNGSIRDLDVIDPRFQLLAGRVSPSHAHVRVEDFGKPVEVFGMTVEEGALLHADRHGAVIIPRQHLPALPDAIDLCTRREAPILQAARSDGFGFEMLKAALEEAEDIH